MLIVHIGVVIQKTDKILPEARTPQHQASDPDMSADEDADAEIPEEVKVMQEIASFDNITVWGHESLPSDTEDVYVKGVDEWVKLAQAVSQVCFQRVQYHPDMAQMHSFD